MNREEALKRSEEALDALAQALERGQSEALVRYLAVLSRFHRYSFGNCMLIALQRPDATHVAGFHRWKDLGRYVKKGAHGIAILAPLVCRSKTNEDDKDVERDDAKRTRAIRGFRVVWVFDIADTEGKELPSLHSVTGDPGERLSRLEAFVRSRGIELEYRMISGGAYGVSSGGTIAVRPDLAPAETFSVLCHELAHELLHKSERRKETTKTVRETEAEAVAFVVATALGLETTTRSSDYIQLWSGDKEVLVESLDHIQKSAASILQALEGGVTATDMPHAA